MLRFEGCKRRRHAWGIPCDTDGWFPIKEILGKSLGGLTANMSLLLSLVSHDEKGRFQISGEFDQRGYLYDYFGIRAVSGHGIPWLEERRLSCPLRRRTLTSWAALHM